MTEQNGLERSSATERLRALLDGRGVEWVAIGTDTCWTGADGYPMRAWETTNGTHMRVADLTPEQAIEATLGRGTCHAIISDNLTESEGMGDAWADCSECGHLLFVLTDPNSEPPNFCPNCGRRIVEVDA